eukprot:jgi/Tetstr1/442127/TSEL_030281.t1
MAECASTHAAPSRAPLGADYAVVEPVACSPPRAPDGKQHDAGEPDACCVLFLGGLPHENVTEELLREALRRYGEVDSAQVVMRSARKNRGFGYVRFREPEGAAAALASPADPPIVLGKALDVRLANGYQPGVVRSKTPSGQSAPRRRVRRLAPGVVRVQSLLSLSEQQRLLELLAQMAADAEAGWRTPTFSDGRRMHLDMMCLGALWDPERRRYEREPSLGRHAGPIPQELQELAARAVALSAPASDGGWDVSLDRPFDVCIANRYTAEGRLGMHRDCDEGEEAIRSGAPVVSLSLGSSAVFEFQPPPESGEASSEAAITRSVHLLSGDALLFGGPARLMPHGLRRLLPHGTPKGLSLAPPGGRINLTLRLL